MKTPRDFWRLLTLALALTLLFAVVACDRGGETEGTGAGTTAVIKPTAEQTTAITTVATTTIRPAASATLQASCDSDGDGANDVYVLYNYLPQQFATPNTVLLEGKDHLSTDLEVNALEMTYGDVKITSYYLNLFNSLDGINTPIENRTLTWKFTVQEDGVYDFCFNIRHQDGRNRGNLILLDGGTPYRMAYPKFAGEEEALALSDSCENAYLLGYSARLTAGEHTIQFKIDVDSPKPLHFRNIYLVKVADLPEA